MMSPKQVRQNDERKRMSKWEVVGVTRTDGVGALMFDGKVALEVVGTSQNLNRAKRVARQLNSAGAVLKKVDDIIEDAALGAVAMDRIQGAAERGEETVALEDVLAKHGLGDSQGKTREVCPAHRCRWHQTGMPPKFLGVKVEHEGKMVPLRYFHSGCPECEAKAEKDPSLRSAPTPEQLNSWKKQQRKTPGSPGFVDWNKVYAYQRKNVYLIGRRDEQ